jgi:hypothetical protein
MSVFINYKISYIIKEEGHPDGKKRLACLDFSILKMGLLGKENALLIAKY